jgi:FkbM family methyltransferase
MTQMSSSRRPTTAEIVATILGEYSTAVADIGARYGIGEAWFRLHPLAAIVGFEADPDECARLNREVAGRRQEHYYPLVLGAAETTAALYRTVSPACSSIYPPDQELAARYPELQCQRLVDSRDISLTTLDQWAESAGRPEISFMKLDTQGSELDILKGATRTLRGCLGLELEVEFSPLYHGQPLFAEVDNYLRGLGFTLWRLDNLVHYSERPSAARLRRASAYYDCQRETSAAGNGRLIWGHALYFRDYRSRFRGEPTARAPLILAALLDAAGDLDGAALCLRAATKVGDPGLSRERIDRLNEQITRLEGGRQGHQARTSGPCAAYHRRISGASALAELGHAAFQLGRYRESEAWFRHAEALAPDCLEFRVKRQLAAARAETARS